RLSTIPTICTYTTLFRSRRRCARQGLEQGEVPGSARGVREGPPRETTRGTDHRPRCLRRGVDGRLRRLECEEEDRDLAALVPALRMRLDSGARSRSAGGQPRRPLGEGG